MILIWFILRHIKLKSKDLRIKMYKAAHIRQCIIITFFAINDLIFNLIMFKFYVSSLALSLLRYFYAKTGMRYTMKKNMLVSILRVISILISSWLKGISVLYIIKLSMSYKLVNQHWRKIIQWSNWYFSINLFLYIYFVYSHPYAMSGMHLNCDSLKECFPYLEHQ